MVGRYDRWIAMNYIPYSTSRPLVRADLHSIVRYSTLQQLHVPVMSHCPTAPCTRRTTDSTTPDASAPPQLLGIIFYHVLYPTLPVPYSPTSPLFHKDSGPSTRSRGFTAVNYACQTLSQLSRVRPQKVMMQAHVGDQSLMRRPCEFAKGT